ncbi:MAG TPA: hypothetical protein VN515_04590 [Terriglobales bacterium]|nr:hypothetical protein [Terriglobales bacterium]
MTLEDTPAASDWKAALVTVRTQIADYQREGTSTPGKLKRAARLRACRMALRGFESDHAAAVGALKQAVSAIEAAEKDDNWRQQAEIIVTLRQDVDRLIGLEA